MEKAQVTAVRARMYCADQFQVKGAADLTAMQASQVIKWLSEGGEDWKAEAPSDLAPPEDRLEL